MEILNIELQNDKFKKIKKYIYNKKMYVFINQSLVIIVHIFFLSIFEPYFYFIYT